MRKRKTIGKIFGIALLFVMIGLMLPLGRLSSHSQDAWTAGLNFAAAHLGAWYAC